MVKLKLMYLELREEVVDGIQVEKKMIFSQERGVPSTGMCGFNQSEWTFLIRIVVVSNQISISFYGIFIENSCPIGNKAPFYTLSFPITKIYLVGELYFGQHERPQNCEKSSNLHLFHQ